MLVPLYSFTAGRIHMIFKNREDFVVELCYGEDYDGTIRR